MIVIATLEAQTGREHEVETALQALIPQVQAEEMTLTYIFHRAEDDPGIFLFYERYTNKEAFEQHLDSPYLKATLAHILPLLRRDPFIARYKELGAINR